MAHRLARCLVSLPVTVMLADSNRAPRAVAPLAFSVDEGQSVHFALRDAVVDDDGDALTFVLDDAPTGRVFIGKKHSK